MRSLAALLTIAALLAPGPLRADDQAITADAAALGARVVEAHIRPAYAAFARAADALREATDVCDAEAARRGFHAAYDAWMGAQHIAFGPVEAEARRFAIVFWPDERGAVRRGLDRLIGQEDPVVGDPAAFAAASVAVRGLSALERLLWTDEGPRDAALSAPYQCRLAAAIAKGLTVIAADLEAGWADGGEWARWIRTPGSEGNAIFLEPGDVAKEVFRSLDSGLEAVSALRLGRPLGTFDRPRPRQAEAWRSGRSMESIRRSLAGLEALAMDVVAPEIEPSLAAEMAAGFERARALADRAPDSFAPLADGPAARPRFEALQSRVRELQGRLRRDVAPALGVAIGFNSLDGD